MLNMYSVIEEMMIKTRNRIQENGCLNTGPRPYPDTQIEDQQDRHAKSGKCCTNKNGLKSNTVHSQTESHSSC